MSNFVLIKYFEIIKRKRCILVVYHVYSLKKQGRIIMVKCFRFSMQLVNKSLIPFDTEFIKVCVFLGFKILRIILDNIRSNCWRNSIRTNGRHNFNTCQLYIEVNFSSSKGYSGCLRTYRALGGRCQDCNESFGAWSKYFSYKSRY